MLKNAQRWNVYKDFKQFERFEGSETQIYQ